MFATKRLTRGVVMLATIAALALSSVPLATAGKPGSTADRAISVEWRRDVWQAPEIRLLREDGSGMSTVNSDPDLGRGGWPRWSPSGQAIGGHYKVLRDAAGNAVDIGLMVMAANGAGQQTAITRTGFDAWNLARAGVVYSFGPHDYACWLGNEALVVGADTEYEPSFFGETDPSFGSFGERLFIVGADGVIAPLTETRIQKAGPDGYGYYDDRSPHWSPVLNKVVFVSNRTDRPVKKGCVLKPKGSSRGA